MEEWKQIPGYERYKVSNLGRIQGTRGEIKPQKDKNGYLFVTIYRNGVGKRQSIHRLVAESFVENPDNLPVVNHMDENKQNNRADNLEWCTGVYNRYYSAFDMKPTRLQVLSALCEASEPMDIQQLIVRIRQTKHIEKNWALMAASALCSSGMCRKDEKGEYSITEQGRTVYKRLNQRN